MCSFCYTNVLKPPEFRAPATSSVTYWRSRFLFFSMRYWPYMKDILLAASARLYLSPLPLYNRTFWPSLILLYSPLSYNPNIVSCKTQFLKSSRCVLRFSIVRCVPGDTLPTSKDFFPLFHNITHSMFTDATNFSS